MMFRNVAFLIALTVGLFAAATANALQDRQDFSAMYNTLNDALDFGRSGITMQYTSNATGNKGTVTAVNPLPSRNGQPCWAFSRTYGPPGNVKRVDGTACKNQLGLWDIVTDSEAGTGTTSISEGGFPPTRDKTVVRDIQLFLSQLAYDPGPADGLYGRRTGGAISAYQRDKNLHVDGQPSVELRNRLKTDVAAAGGDTLPWLKPTQETSAPPVATAPAPAPAPAPTPAPAPQPATAPAPAPAPTASPTAPAPAPAPAPSPAPTTTPAPAPTPSTASGDVAVADLASGGGAMVGRSVTARGTYLHYSGAWAKLLASDDPTADFVYLLMERLTDAERSALRSDCFLCNIRVEGIVERRELVFAGSSQGMVPAIVVSKVTQID